MWNDLYEQKRIQTAPGYALYFIGINYKPEEQRHLKDPQITVRGMRVKSFVE